MRFSDEVIRFDFAGIPMVGNLANGYAIGLTEEGATVCDRLLTEDVCEADIAAVDQALLVHLNQAEFFGLPHHDIGVKSVYFHVTQRCNLDCVGCYSLSDARNTLPDASYESAARVLDELARAGVMGLIVSGGEPFLREDLADLMIHAKRDCGFQSISVLSNGTCIDEEQLKRMVGYVDRVSVSFDGCSPDSIAYIRQEQRFEQLVEAVRTIQAAGLESHIIATIHSKNFRDIARYDALAKELGVGLSLSLLSCGAGVASMQHLAPTDEDLTALGRLLLSNGGSGLAINDAPIGLNITVKTGCGAGKSSLSIDADGTVYPCHMLHSSELAMGNLFTMNIEDVLHGETAMAFNTLDVRSFEECGSCEFMWICGGGCRGRALAAFGNLVSPDGYCTMIKEFYGGLGKRLNELISSK